MAESLSLILTFRLSVCQTSATTYAYGQQQLPIAHTNTLRRFSLRLRARDCCSVHLPVPIAAAVARPPISRVHLSLSLSHRHRAAHSPSAPALLVASLPLAPAAADSTQHRYRSCRLILSPAHVLCCIPLHFASVRASSQYNTQPLVAALPAVVGTADHSHGQSRCQG
jgi:hypothetical protein